MISKEDLLLEMVRLTASVDIGFNPNIYSIPYLAEHLGQTQYAVRKAMKELEADGLVKKTHYGELSEWTWEVWCVHGWSITKKVKDSEQYKKCEEKAWKEFEKWQRAFEREWDEEHSEERREAQS